MNVSVIIPTYNAGPDFGEVLNRLWAQTVKPWEIIVLDSSSQDGTAAVAERMGARVTVIPQRDFDHGGTRNRGAACSQGDILMFMTQDAVPADENLIEQFVGTLADPRVGGVYARQLPKENADILEKLSRSYNYPPISVAKTKEDLSKLGMKTFFYSNVCSAMRRDVFEEMEHFAEPVLFNEDMFMAAKCIIAGYSIVYNADAKVYHSHQYNATQLMRRFFDNGVSLSKNSWIQAYTNVHHAGAGLVRMQLKELWRNRQWSWISRLLIESGAKYIGFQLGTYHRLLPISICSLLSLQPNRWRSTS